MIYITTKNVNQIIRDSQEVRDGLIREKEELNKKSGELERSLKYWKNKAKNLEDELFESSIVNNLYDIGIRNRDGHYKIISYMPKDLLRAIGQSFGKKFNTKHIYTFDELVKQIKKTDQNLKSYTIIEVTIND
ncbi:hypothetical protein EFT49_10645 [Leuconostoc falkenbergense]|uniref:hypothetical protein n=1 Tax=Leuconostoc falkenbergense TaxID=2766470 RepID=UPI0021AA73B3|nr:hypothetical protein [Leuconostoc falkenbergense]MCT4420622.1 hypothetical protein [Leuconostoc falkenbergense]